MSEWIVHKFGGTSVADAERYRAAADIVLAQRSRERVAVVVSAMSGVTNALIRSVELAAAQDNSYLPTLEALKTGISRRSRDLNFLTRKATCFSKQSLQISMLSKRC